jgi:nucleoside-diphosphate-sugar epimerase
MTVVVTGGTGFLGAATLPLLAQDDDVVALHRPGARTSSVDNVSWVEQDLTAPLTVKLPDRVGGVVHLAQSRRYREFPDGAIDIFEINSALTVRLLDYCRRAGGQHFVYASSGAVYAAGAEPVREHDTPAPGNFYGVSKLAAEQAATQYAGLLNVAVLRFFFIYGPGQENMFIPGLVERVRNGTPVMLAGDDGIRVNPVYLADAAKAVQAALALDGGGVFNVAGAEIGVEPSFSNGPAQGDLVADLELMRTRLRAPEVGMQAGLREVIAARER